MMDSIRSPAKLVLLAVEYAKQSDVDSLHQLVIRNDTVFQTELVLRILLTFLPETTPPHAYTKLLQALDNKDAQQETEHSTLPTVEALEGITDEQAAQRVRKLRLRKLSGPESTAGDGKDSLTTFMFQRSYALDEEAGMLNHVTDLLIPFVGHAPAIRTWLASTVIPLCRRNLEYRSQGAISTLREFQELPDRAAVGYLLSPLGLEGHENLGRDLRVLLSPWIYADSRWTSDDEKGGAPSLDCPGWEEFRGWLVRQSSKSWLISSGAVKQWDGPQDVDFGSGIRLELDNSRLQHLEKSYVRAILASVTSITEPSLDALNGAWEMLAKARTLIGLEAPHGLQETVDRLPGSVFLSTEHPNSSKPASALLRNDLLDSQNVLTEPSEAAIEFLQMLTLTAYLLTRLGISCTLKTAGDLVLRRDSREQKAQLVKLIRLAANQSPKSDDDYWKRVRNEVLWLHSPGAEGTSTSDNDGRGAFGTISRHDVEAELLKAMLSQSRTLIDFTGV